MSHLFFCQCLGAGCRGRATQQNGRPRPNHKTAGAGGGPSPDPIKIKKKREPVGLGGAGGSAPLPGGSGGKHPPAFWEIKAKNPRKKYQKLQFKYQKPKS